ncbi:hypothetical protein [Pelagibacterium xiamenense]|uniref:hypothetical protein n=1 Tax=Pelagibacterium xiamenense TaxID=2901140 RepID=UPI001E3563FA|nr:hypothetical protein [Pelagibacterium xiamenense]MCD7058799.1 hypothetical protein [Pelagibacterium xiamenense]
MGGAGITSRPTLSGARFALIVLGGPPVGALVYVIAALFIEGGAFPGGETVQIVSFLFIMGSVMGLFPAFLAATAWAFLPKPSALLQRMALAAATGACAGAGGIVLMTPVLDIPVPTADIQGLLALCGAVALVTTASPLSGKAAN